MAATTRRTKQQFLCQKLHNDVMSVAYLQKEQQVKHGQTCYESSTLLSSAGEATSSAGLIHIKFAASKKGWTAGKRPCCPHGVGQLLTCLQRCTASVAQCGVALQPTETTVTVTSDNQTSLLTSLQRGASRAQDMQKHLVCVLANPCCASSHFVNLGPLQPLSAGHKAYGECA